MTDRPETQIENKLPTTDRPREFRSSSLLGITAILSCTIIILACLASGTVVLAYFFSNPPW